MSSIVGNFSSGVTARRQGQAEKDVRERNAILAVAEGLMAAEASKKQTKHISGEQKALYGKAGVDISEGSPLLMISETAAEGQLEIERIRWATLNQVAMESYYGRIAEQSGKKQAETQYVIGGMKTAASIAGGVAGAAGASAAGGSATLGAVQGALQGSSGDMSSFGNLLASAMGSRSSYGLGTVGTNYGYGSRDYYYYRR